MILLAADLYFSGRVPSFTTRRDASTPGGSLCALSVLTRNAFSRRGVILPRPLLRGDGADGDGSGVLEAPVAGEEDGVDAGFGAGGGFGEYGSGGGMLDLAGAGGCGDAVGGLLAVAYDRVDCIGGGSKMAFCDCVWMRLLYPEGEVKCRVVGLLAQRAWRMFELDGGGADCTVLAITRACGLAKPPAAIVVLENALLILPLAVLGLSLSCCSYNRVRYFSTQFLTKPSPVLWLTHFRVL